MPGTTCIGIGNVDIRQDQVAAFCSFGFEVKPAFDPQVAQFDSPEVGLAVRQANGFLIRVGVDSQP